MLRDQLPTKEEHVILVRLSPIQRALYTEFMKRFREAGNTGWLGLNPLKAFCVCCKVRLWIFFFFLLKPLFTFFLFFFSFFFILSELLSPVSSSSSPSRSGITQTSSMKPCRKRIRPTSRTWTLMTSLQLATLAALHPVLASNPKWQTQATVKSTALCHHSIPLRTEPIKSSHMNGYVTNIELGLTFLVSLFNKHTV